MKVKVGDIILMEFGFREEEFIVKRITRDQGRILLNKYHTWHTTEDLEKRSAEVIGHYVKILGPIGYKKYYGEEL